MTMQEIADLAGVHKSTVGKVIHNHPGVSDEVRMKIQKLLEEHDYQPNRAAQALQYQKKEIKIGILLINVDALASLQCGILTGLKKYKEYNIKTEFFYVSTWEYQKMADKLHEMSEKNFDGVIVSPINAGCVRTALQELSDKNIPVITVNSDIDGVSRLCYVGQDGIKASQTAGRLMAECLDKKGKIAVITSAIAEENNSYYVKIREEYFIQYIRQNYPELVIADVIESMENKEITQQKTAELLNRVPDLGGIYITCGGVADVAKMVQKSGKSGTIKIIGYESYTQIIELIEEDCITFTIDSDIRGQGQLAVKHMMNYLLNGKKPKTSKVYTNSRILIKEML